LIFEVVKIERFYACLESAAKYAKFSIGVFIGPLKAATASLMRSWSEIGVANPIEITRASVIIIANSFMLIQSPWDL